MRLLAAVVTGVWKWRKNLNQKIEATLNIYNLQDWWRTDLKMTSTHLLGGRLVIETKKVLILISVQITK